MLRMRLPVRVLAFLLAAAAAACAAGFEGGEEANEKRFPVSSDYPPGTMERGSFTAGVAEGWRISTLHTPERPDADWRIVIITGTPSWNEYWAPTLAAMPANRSAIVADRPGFARSEPQHAVRDLTAQADALAPMLQTRPGERVLLVGQSFGAPVATLMAQRHADQVDALLLVSAFYGDAGPTARRMLGVGRALRPILSRDLRNSIEEVSAQRDQLPGVWSAFAGLQQPIAFVHGDADSFVPLAANQRIADEHGRSLIVVPGGDHFLNACCVPALIDAMEHVIREAEARDATPGSSPTAP